MSVYKAIAVCGPNLPISGPTFHLHAANCADLHKGIYKHINEKDVMQADSLRTIVLDVYPPDDFQYSAEDWQDYADDFKVFPCVKFS